MYKERNSLSRKIDHKIWECPTFIHSSARQKKERGRVGSEEKVSADDYQLKSCILCQSTELLSSGSYLRKRG